ncbi:MAG: hypothetical protein IT372_39830, partial [Polyangiaceae bacterium]|nr:hypothetical protein [Polyangiaceae bacterium]
SCAPNPVDTRGSGSPSAPCAPNPVDTRGSGSPSAPCAPNPVELARGAAWLLGLAAAAQLAGQALGASPLAAALAGAVVADLGSARAGVRWDDPAGAHDRGERRAVAARIGAGAGLAALALAIAAAGAAALGWARVEAGSPSAALALALLRSAGIAVRDELILTGIPFAVAARAGIPGRLALAFAALAHGAALALAPGASAAAVTLAIAAGALTAALWQRRGAWAAIACAAALHFLSGAGLRGGLLDVTWLAGTLGAGARASGAVAWLAAASLAAVALLEGPLARAMDRRGDHDRRRAAPGSAAAP